MFTTVNNVKEYTNVTVELGLIKRAQSLVEIFIGKNEIDIENPNDLILLDKMTAYQAAYMLENEDMVYSQIASTSSGQTDSLINFDTKMSSPWMSPLAVIASKGLSFNRPRSIKTGKIFQWNRRPISDWWTN